MATPFDVDLVTSAAFARSGRSSRQLGALLETRVLVRVRPGVYAPAAQWEPLPSEQRAVVAARAHALVVGGDPVFSHETAAAIHGLPLFRTDATRVHVTTDAMRSGLRTPASRHRPIAGARTVERSGLVVHDLATTIADLACASSAESVVAAADAALRRTERAGGDAEELRAEIVAAVRTRTRGAKRGEQLVLFAAPRADGPGESVSRFFLHVLGFAPPRLQVPVRAPGGGWYYADFGLDDVAALGEFDGETKYRDPRMRGGRCSADIVMEEKRREDWIRGVTGLRLIRWGMRDIATPAVFARRLRAFGIGPPVRPV